MKANKAPTPDASVGVAIPVQIEPRTPVIRIPAGTKLTRIYLVFSPTERALLSSRGRAGPFFGFIFVTVTM